jgi:hypothetical protein
MFHYGAWLAPRLAEAEVRTKALVCTAQFQHEWHLPVSASSLLTLRHLEQAEGDQLQCGDTPTKSSARQDRFDLERALRALQAFDLRRGLPRPASYPSSRSFRSSSFTRTSPGAHGHKQWHLHEIPLLHKTVLNTLCAGNHLLRRYAESAIGAVSLPEPYIPQYLFAERSKSAQAVTPGGRSESLAGLFAIQRRALLIDRSGTGNACCCAIWRETGTP